ncbi:LysR family transcriptional regulator [Lentzea nigeriaca]|uniref:LysR family transcriptional regulator n=1 Tax=Lentzea nigeriaca TaxID=1128665 RepID=UPI00195D167F
MHVAQPSLSQQIQALEKELGAELLERGRQGISLTAAGRIFLPGTCGARLGGIGPQVGGGPGRRHRP